jgi:hypothetical protein
VMDANQLAGGIREKSDHFRPAHTSGDKGEGWLGGGSGMRRYGGTLGGSAGNRLGKGGL